MFQDNVLVSLDIITSNFFLNTNSGTLISAESVAPIK